MILVLLPRKVDARGSDKHPDDEHETPVKANETLAVVAHLFKNMHEFFVEVFIYRLNDCYRLIRSVGNGCRGRKTENVGTKKRKRRRKRAIDPCTDNNRTLGKNEKKKKHGRRVWSETLAKWAMQGYMGKIRGKTKRQHVKPVSSKHDAALKLEIVNKPKKADKKRVMVCLQGPVLPRRNRLLFRKGWFTTRGRHTPRYDKVFAATSLSPAKTLLATSKHGETKTPNRFSIHYKPINRGGT